MKRYAENNNSSPLKLEDIAVHYKSSGRNWEIVDAIRKNVAINVFEAFWQKAVKLSFTKKEYAELLNINVRTLDRNLKEKVTIDNDKIEKAIRLYRCMNHGIDVFENADKFSHWLREKNLSLNEYPINLFNSIAGIDLIEGALLQIEYGVYA